MIGRRIGENAKRIGRQMPLAAGRSVGGGVRRRGSGGRREGGRYRGLKRD